MKKNLRSKILLCVLAGGVLAANTALADAPDEILHEDGNDPYAIAKTVYQETYSKSSGKIEAVAEGSGNARAYALYVNNGTADLGNVEISAVAVSDSNDVGAYAIYADNGSKVDITGGSINAIANDGKKTAYAIYSSNSDVDVTSKNISINGDIRNDGNGTININLNSKNAVLNGSVRNNGDEINLVLTNGATWNTAGHFRSEITNLIMDNGIIKPGIDRMAVENYSGAGEVIYMLGDDTSGDGSIDVDGGRIDIENASSGSVINLTVTNNNLVSTTDNEKALENLNELAKEVRYDAHDGNLTGKVTIKEGLIMPEVSGDLLFKETGNNEGYVSNITSKKTTKTMDVMKNIAATAIVAWRQEDSTLSQRLGELRESDGGQGIWVRMSRGEFEYDGEYKNQYNFFQMGYDWAAGNWHYGAAVSHNDGQTTYTHGDGENRSTSLSLYGTWLGDKGHYADIVLKQGRLSNDFDIYTEAGHTSGDYDAWGTSLSGEYSMKVNFDGGWYVTPQAQFTLMRIGGEDYTTNNGIKVNQDSLESAVGLK